ncbi:MAG: glycosyltransferase family 39 protein, partial [Candidatus Altiarchaeota archaeon]
MARYGIVLIFLLALLFRAYDLVSVPVWMWDEGANINYASNLAEGRAQLFGFKYHFIPHPPLYFLFLIPFLKAMGPGILALRVASVVLSMSGLLLVYLIIRNVLGESWALLGGLFYALMPELVFWGRLGFANNLLAVLAVASVYLIQKHFSSGEDRFMYYASLTAGVCLLTEYGGIVFVLSLLVIVYWYARRLLSKTLILSLGPFMVFVLLMLASDFHGFTTDFLKFFRLYFLAIPAIMVTAILFHRFSDRLLGYTNSLYYGIGETPAEFVLFLLISLFSLLPLDYTVFLSGSYVSALLAFSFFSLFFIQEGRFRNTLMLYSFSYLLLLFSLNRWDHMGIPLPYLLSCSSVFFIKKAGQ